MFRSYEDYENELERQRWLEEREEYLEEQADQEYYERRYGYDETY